LLSNGVNLYHYTVVWPTCLQSYQSVLNNERVRRLNDITVATLKRRRGGGGEGEGEGERRRGDQGWLVLDVFPMTEAREDNLENHDVIHWCGDVKREKANLLMHRLCGCGDGDGDGEGTGVDAVAEGGGDADDAPPPFPPSPEHASTPEPEHKPEPSPKPIPTSPPTITTATTATSATSTSTITAASSSWDPSVNPDVDPTGRWNFHSLGRVKPYSAADLEAPGALRAAAAARSFDGEIILIVANGAVSDMVANFALNLAALKMAHYLIVTDQPSGCKEITAAAGGVAAGACGWTSYMSAQLGADKGSESPFSLDDLGPVSRLWISRYHYTAELVGLGYNVFVSDLDVFITQNPYPFLKSPKVMGDYSVIAQKEGSKFPSLNCGLVYIQDAAANRLVTTRGASAHESRRQSGQHGDGDVDGVSVSGSRSRSRSQSGGLDLVRRIVLWQRSYLTGKLTSKHHKTGESIVHALWDQNMLNSAFERAACGCEVGAGGGWREGGRLQNVT
jgi:hypothetical protein